MQRICILDWFRVVHLFHFIFLSFYLSSCIPKKLYTKILTIIFTQGRKAKSLSDV